MINQQEKPQQTGQTLIEFVIVLPLLLLLVATIFPFVRFGTLTPWLDERLWLSQFVRPEKIVHTELEHSHEKNLVPTYFSREDLLNTEKSETFGFSIPLLGDSFPGSFHVEGLCATWKEKPGPLLNADFLPKKISRDFAMIRKTPMPERKVPFLVRELTLSRFLKGGSGLFDFLKLQIFHLNLNILPAEERRGR